MRRNEKNIFRLYRHFAGDGTLLYIGSTINPIIRLGGHRVKSEWFADIRRIEIEPYATKELLLQAEKAAIQDERPKYNINGKQPPPRVNVEFFAQMAAWAQRKSEILSMISSGVSQAEIARQLGVKRQRIHQIVSGR